MLTHPLKNTLGITIKCPICNLDTQLFNNQHFADRVEKICIECHADINYYLSIAEDDHFKYKECPEMKKLIEERKAIYGSRPCQYLNLRSENEYKGVVTEIIRINKANGRECLSQKQKKRLNKFAIYRQAYISGIEEKKQ